MQVIQLQKILSGGSMSLLLLDTLSKWNLLFWMKWVNYMIDLKEYVLCAWMFVKSSKPSLSLAHLCQKLIVRDRLERRVTGLGWCDWYWCCPAIPSWYMAGLLLVGFTAMGNFLEEERKAVSSVSVISNDILKSSIPATPFSMTTLSFDRLNNITLYSALIKSSLKSLEKRVKRDLLLSLSRLGLTERLATLSWLLNHFHLRAFPFTLMGLLFHKLPICGLW